MDNYYRETVQQFRYISHASSIVFETYCFAKIIDSVAVYGSSQVYRTEGLLYILGKSSKSCKVLQFGDHIQRNQFDKNAYYELFVISIKFLFNTSL